MQTKWVWQQQQGVHMEMRQAMQQQQQEEEVHVHVQTWQGMQGPSVMMLTCRMLTRLLEAGMVVVEVVEVVKLMLLLLPEFYCRWLLLLVSLKRGLAGSDTGMGIDGVNSGCSNSTTATPIEVRLLDTLSDAASDLYCKHQC